MQWSSPEVQALFDPVTPPSSTNGSATSTPASTSPTPDPTSSGTPAPISSAPNVAAIVGGLLGVLALLGLSIMAGCFLLNRRRHPTRLRIYEADSGRHMQELEHPQRTYELSPLGIQEISGTQLRRELDGLGRLELYNWALQSLRGKSVYSTDV